MAALRTGKLDRDGGSLYALPSGAKKNERAMPSWVSYNMLTFILFLALVAGAAFFGGQWGAKDWYRTLSKPSWTPPSWLFAPAWILLYVLIAAAGTLVWNSGHESRSLLIAIWGLQLVLNGPWSYIFFGRKELGLALADIAALWLSIAALIVLAWPVSQTASILFMPYLAWVSYAAALNASIWRRNTAEV
jgi:translocator protein